MEAIKNPFSPGAGSPPPELVGRESILESARILFGRIIEKRPEKSILLTRKVTYAVMVILVFHSIQKKEFGGQVTADPRRVFAKIKNKPDLAEQISPRGLPSRTTPHKVYATKPSGGRRLLFFCRNAQPPGEARLGLPMG